MIRLFLAVPVPKEIKRRLAAEIEKVKKSLPDWKINWVTPENFHITLLFLGWVREEDIERVKREAADAVCDFPTFEISAGPLTFEERPIWLEITGGRKDLQRLQEALGTNLSTKGSYFENRIFHPHLTIGRVKNKGRTKSPQIKKTFSWKADRIVLYESKLRRKGPIYTELASFSQVLK